MGYAQPVVLYSSITSHRPSQVEQAAEQRTEAWKQAERLKAQQAILERATTEWRASRFKT